MGSSGVGSKISLLNNKLNNNGTISPRLVDHESRDTPALSVQLERLLSSAPETMSDQETYNN